MLVDDELIDAFYDQRVPADVHNGAGFEQWHKDAERDNPKLLYLTREELMRHEAAGITTDAVPEDDARSAGIELRCRYHFEPGSRARRRDA